MSTNRRRSPQARALIETQARMQAYWDRSKNMMLVMLGLWITYFLVINFFVRTLNRITVPVLEFPLGFFLAGQGAVIVFVVTLVWLARRDT